MSDRYKDVLEWLQAIVIAIVLSVIIRLFLFEVILVEGSSMIPTLHEGDRLIVSKAEYRLTTPESGDIIVFRNTEGPRENYIKRVIGVAGDQVEIKDGFVYINENPLDEPYIIEPFYDSFAETTVPPGSVFVLGDNRNHSRDSRNPYVGFISYDNIIGKARLRIWPVWDIEWFN
jgi:signal peptidase I